VSSSSHMLYIYHIAARTMQDIPAMMKPISWSDLVDRYLKRYTDNTETGSADAMLITTKNEKNKSCVVYILHNT
jgi:hypothetical protein